MERWSTFTAEAPRVVVAVLVFAAAACDDGTVTASASEASATRSAALPTASASATPSSAAGAPAGSVVTCCEALHQQMLRAPLEAKGAYMSARATCRAAAGGGDPEAALRRVRALLGGREPPEACRLEAR